MAFGELVEDDRLYFQAHQVTTIDGYKLTMHRISSTPFPNITRKGYHQEEKKRIAFLQHGILSSSETFIMRRNESLAFKLARQGFDVWLGNNRGNAYSRFHKNYHPELNKSQSALYYDYSFYDMAKYDLPAMIDYALTTSNTDQLAYVGHS